MDPECEQTDWWALSHVGLEGKGKIEHCNRCAKLAEENSTQTDKIPVGNQPMLIGHHSFRNGGANTAGESNFLASLYAI